MVKRLMASPVRSLSSHSYAPPACTAMVTSSGTSTLAISYISCTQALCKSVPHMYIMMVVEVACAHAAGSSSAASKSRTQ